MTLRSQTPRRPPLTRAGLRCAAWGVTRGLSALGWVSFFTLFCFGCSGLPVLAGLFGGVAVGTRFGVSAGVAGAVVSVFAVARARRQGACAVPAAEPRLPARQRSV